MEGNIETKSDQVKKAKMEILAIQGEVSLMGANDYEIPALNNIIERLEKGECSPAEALKEAYQIRSSKQDYH